MQGNIIESMLCNVHLLISSFRFWYQIIMYKNTSIMYRMKYWFQIKINYSCFEILKKEKIIKPHFMQHLTNCPLKADLFKLQWKYFFFMGIRLQFFQFDFLFKKHLEFALNVVFDCTNTNTHSVFYASLPYICFEVIFNTTPNSTNQSLLLP